MKGRIRILTKSFQIHNTDKKREKLLFFSFLNGLFSLRKRNIQDVVPDRGHGHNLELKKSYLINWLPVPHFNKKSKISSTNYNF